MNSPGDGRVLSYRQAWNLTFSQSREVETKPSGLSSVLILRKLKSSPLSDIQLNRHERCARFTCLLGDWAYRKFPPSPGWCGKVIGWCSFLPCPVRNDPVLHYVVPQHHDGAVELQRASSAAPLDSSSPRPVLPRVEALEKQNMNLIRVVQLFKP